MKISFKERDWDLLASETFIVPELGTAVVTIGPQENSLTFEFEFITDDGAEDKEPQLEWKPKDDRTLHLKFTNWNNPLGTGLINPIPVGTFSKRELWLLLFINKAGSKGQQRVVTLSFYLGKEVADGED